MKAQGRRGHARLRTHPPRSSCPHRTSWAGGSGFEIAEPPGGRDPPRYPWVGAGVRRHWRDGCCWSRDRGLFFSTSSSLNRTCVWGTTFTRSAYIPTDNPSSVHK